MLMPCRAIEDRTARVVTQDDHYNNRRHAMVSCMHAPAVPACSMTTATRSEALPAAAQHALGRHPPDAAGGTAGPLHRALWLHSDVFRAGRQQGHRQLLHQRRWGGAADAAAAGRPHGGSRWQHEQHTRQAHQQHLQEVLCCLHISSCWPVQL